MFLTLELYLVSTERQRYPDVTIQSMPISPPLSRAELSQSHLLRGSSSYPDNLLIPSVPRQEPVRGEGCITSISVQAGKTLTTHFWVLISIQRL